MINERNVDSLFATIKPGMSVIFQAGTGMGKNYQTERLSNKFKVPMVKGSINMLKYVSFPNAKDVHKAIIFMDEAHGLKQKEQDCILPIIDAGVVEGMNESGKIFKVQPVYIFATNYPEKLVPAIRSRSITFIIPPYVPEEIYQMYHGQFKIKDEDLRNISKRCKCNPRIAKNMIDSFLNNGELAYQIWDVDNFGLNTNDRNYLKKIYMSEVCSLTELSDYLLLSPEGIEEVVESYFRQQGFISITSKGRRLTEKGRVLALDVCRRD